MQNGFAPAALTLLQHITTSNTLTPDSPAAVAAAAATAAAAAAGALRAFTTADDERPPASKAFLHARLLAGKPHHALTVLLPVLRQLQGQQQLAVGPLTAVVGAIRQVGLYGVAPGGRGGGQWVVGEGCAGRGKAGAYTLCWGSKLHVGMSDATTCLWGEGVDVCCAGP